MKTLQLVCFIIWSVVCIALSLILTFGPMIDGHPWWTCLFFPAILVVCWGANRYLLEEDQ